MAPVADLYQEAYNRQWFDGQAETPIKFYDLVKNRSEQQQQARSSYNDLLGEVAEGTFRQLTSDASIIPSLRLEDWRATQPESAQWIPENRLIADTQLLQAQLQHQLKQQGEDVHDLIAYMAERSGKPLTTPLPLLTPEKKEALLDRLTDMPLEKRQSLFQLTSLLGQQFESKPTNPFSESWRRVDQLASAVGRSIAGPVRQGNRTSQQISLDNRLRELASDKPLYAVPNASGQVELLAELEGASGDPRIPVRGFVPKGWVPATPEQRKQESVKVHRQLRRLQVERELDNSIENQFDKLKPVPLGTLSQRNDWIGFISRTRDKAEQGLYDFGSSIVPSLAAGSGVGLSVVYLAQVSQAFDEAMYDNPDADPRYVLGYSIGAGAINTGLERLKFDTLTERIPFLRKLSQKVPTPKFPKGLQTTARVGAVMGGEYLLENAQNLVTIVGLQTLEELAPGMKNVPLSDAINQLMASQERIIFAILPFAGLAAGRIALTDLKGGQAFLKDPQGLSYLGLTEEQVARVTAEPNPERAVAILQEEYAKLTPEQHQSGVKTLIDDIKEEEANISNDFAVIREQSEPPRKTVLILTKTPIPLTPADIGIEGKTSELRMTISLQENIAHVKVDMIKAKDINPCTILPALKEIARANGAHSIKIDAFLANEDLYAILKKRYKLETTPTGDTFTINLK